MNNIPYGYCNCGCGGKTNIAPRTDERSGHRKGEPFRYIRGHQTRKPVRYTVVDCGFTTPCWVWNGPTPPHGYAQFMRGGKTEKAHRHMYELHKGSIPHGLELDHLCGIKACVNPDHLEAVTHLENMQRADNTKKLSLAQQSRIAKMYATGAWTQRELAEIFKVDQACISRHIKKHKAS